MIEPVERFGGIQGSQKYIATLFSEMVDSLSQQKQSMRTAESLFKTKLQVISLDKGSKLI